MKIETNEPLATVLIANYNNSKYIDTKIYKNVPDINLSTDISYR